MERKIEEAFEAFNKMKVLIIGDAMIDAYVYGKVNRMSPEAPVPVVDVITRESRLGGAANVAKNIQSMGATPILCTTIGDDSNAVLFFDLLKKQGLEHHGIIKSANRTTTVKTRIISNNRQIVRVDEETIAPLSENEELLIVKKIQEMVEKHTISALIFEDYDKGCITKGLIKKVVSFANENNIKTTVDPKFDHFLDYQNVTLFKPNFKELEDGLGLKLEKDEHTLIKYDKKLRSLLNHKLSLITLSEKGIFVSDNSDAQVVPAHLRNIADVSGAGDTVIAVATLCLAANLSTWLIAQISNLAGGLVCEKSGVVSINKQNLLEESLSVL